MTDSTPKRIVVIVFMKNIPVLIVIIAAIVVIFGGLMILTRRDASSEKITPKDGIAAINISEQPTITQVMTGSEVAIVNYKFSPGTLVVKKGQTINWTNKDVLKHTVVADDSSFTSNELKKDQVFSFTFNKAGTFSYKCGIHPSMTGKIVVE